MFLKKKRTVCHRSVVCEGGGSGWVPVEVGLVGVQKLSRPKHDRVEGVLLALTQPLAKFEEFRRQHF